MSVSFEEKDDFQPQPNYAVQSLYQLRSLCFELYSSNVEFTITMRSQLLFGEESGDTL